MLQIVSVLLAAIALSPALSHVLEMPGKLRLERENYLTVQAIYRPGFTIAGVSEIGALATAMVLTLTTRGAASWMAFAAAGCFVAMQVVYWALIRPVNRYWRAQEEMGGLA